MANERLLTKADVREIPDHEGFCFIDQCPLCEAARDVAQDAKTTAYWQAKYAKLVEAARVNDKTHDHVAYIRSQLDTRKKWNKDDYAVFYDSDVTFLLNFAEGVKKALRDLEKP